MSDKPEPKFAVGDRVVCVGDSIDGSWEGEEGEIAKVEWNDGGIFAGPRYIYSVRFDCDPDHSEDELDNSDTFELEPA